MRSPNVEFYYYSWGERILFALLALPVLVLAGVIVLLSIAGRVGYEFFDRPHRS